MELPLNRPVLTNDCGSDVLAGAEKGNLLDWNRCVCHCVNIFVQSALRCTTIQKFVEPLVELARKFSRSRCLWMEFKKVQLEMIHREGECSDDEGDADLDGEEGPSYNAKGKPQVKMLLMLLTLVSTRSNSMYYLIKRAPALKDPLIKFIKSMPSTFPSEASPPLKSAADGMTDAPLWRPSCHNVPISPPRQ